MTFLVQYISIWCYEIYLSYEITVFEYCNVQVLQITINQQRKYRIIIFELNNIFSYCIILNVFISLLSEI